MNAFVFSELNDASPDVIDGEVPELLKAILAQDPNVFKGVGFTNATSKYVVACAGMCRLLVLIVYA